MKKISFSMENAKMEAGNIVMSMVYELKKLALSEQARQTYEAYLLDDKYDVRITVMLIPKRSQYERGMEMFLG